MSAIKLSTQYKQHELAITALKSLKLKLQSPSDQHTLKRLHLVSSFTSFTDSHQQIQETLIECNQLERAKELIEECIEGLLFSIFHNSERISFN